MLHKLWSRGFFTSSNTASSPQSILQSTPTPSSSLVLVPSRPLRFVYCDDKGKFHLDPEGVEFLQQIKGPTAVVSVCGRARQGKSFLLNQLLGRSSGFEVASTHQPCTKGLWIWSAPLKQIAYDGTEYYILFLDSEGIDTYDQTKMYSTQIFTLAVALSSMFIYNQMGGIDESAIDCLSLVTEVTKHIHIRAGGERATTSEIARFSPVFVWLLRDFYLDLSEDSRKITPRDYLEIALSPMQGGKDLTAKNEIRESIRALFPDRECFVLMRPLNNESDLHRLDQFSLDDLRPEFRSGLNALKNYVLERTRPKQVEASVLTGPLLAGFTKSFLDAINSGAVPSISTSLQSVEERECRRAYESATEIYMFSFDRTKPLDEDVLREVHDIAVQKSIAAFSSTAVGSGPARQKYEKLLQFFFEKAFEDYKRNAFLKADLKCSDVVLSMEKKLWAACHSPDTKLEDVIKILDGLIIKYEKSSDGPAKWQKLVIFLQQSFQGPIYYLVKKMWDQIESEKSNLMFQCHLNEEKLRSLEKQLEESEKYKADYLSYYEKAVKKKNKMVDEYNRHTSDLGRKYANAVEAFDAAKLESADWERKYQHSSLKQREAEELASAEIATLRSRSSAAEASLAVAREQSMIFQAEALDWKQKYDEAVIEAKTALEKEWRIQEHNNEHKLKREEALRAEFMTIMTKKEEEIKEKQEKIISLEDCLVSSRAKLKEMELKLENYDWETSMLKLEIKDLHEKLDHAEATAQLHHKEEHKLLHEKRDLEQYQFDFQLLKDAENCEISKIEAETEPDQSMVEVNISCTGKRNVHCRSLERDRQTEGVEGHVNSLEIGEADSAGEVEMLLNAASDEMDRSRDCQVSQVKANWKVEIKSTNGAKDALSFQKCNFHTLTSSMCTRPVPWFCGRVASNSRLVRTQAQRNGHGILSRPIGIPYKPSLQVGNCPIKLGRCTKNERASNLISV